MSKDSKRIMHTDQCNLVSQRIRTLREEKRVSYAQLAEFTGLSESTVRRYLSKPIGDLEREERCIPDLNFIFGAAALLGVEPSIFFEDRNNIGMIQAVNRFKNRLKQPGCDAVKEVDYALSLLADAFKK